MITFTQAGFYYAGTFGYPLLLTLVDEKGEPMNLDGVTKIQLSLKLPYRPAMERPLEVPAPLGDVGKNVVQYIIQEGDLKIAGIYKVRLRLISPGKELVAGGQLTVLE